MTNKICYTKDYISKFFDWQIQAATDGKGGAESGLVTLRQEGAIYKFSHNKWHNTPVILDMTNLQPCKKEFSEFGAIMILYVIGKINFLLDPSNQTLSLVEGVNKGIEKKMDLVNKLTLSER